MVWSGVTNIVKLHKSGRETNYMYTDIFMNDITVKNCKYAAVMFQQNAVNATCNQKNFFIILICK